MGCCRRLFGKPDTGPRQVICLNLVIPVRILAFVLLGGNWAYIMLNPGSIGGIEILITAITIALSWIMLKECRRSVLFHRELEKLEGKSFKD